MTCQNKNKFNTAVIYRKRKLVNKMTKISELPNSMDERSNNEYIKNFSKRMLRTQLFVATFQEKRYVEPLKSYRDVVKVDSDEKEFIENILAVRKKLRQERPTSSKWIGITGPDTIGAPVGYNLWVILPIEVFGTYWFKVKTVEFLENEVRVKLDIVRPVRNEKSVSDVSEADDSSNFDLKSSIQDLSNSIRSNITNIAKTHLTVTNIKGTVIFTLLLIGSIIGGGVNVVKYLMEYLLKFMQETSGFIKVCTPIIISCIDLIRKTIYGLFTLIVVLVHGRPNPRQMYSPHINPNNMIAYEEPRYRRRGLPYNSSVTIEEIR